MALDRLTRITTSGIEDGVILTNPTIVGAATATSFSGDITGDVTGEINSVKFDTNSSGVVVSGIITATTFQGGTFVGDGAGLVGVTASGSGVNVSNSDSIVGVAGTINFGTGIDVSPVSAGVVTTTVSSVTVGTGATINGTTNTITALTNSEERLRIRSDGDVFIGTDADDLESQLGSRRRLAVCDTTNGALLHLRGQSPAIFFDQSGGNVGKMYLDAAGFEIHSGTPATEGTNVFTIDSNGYRSFSTQPYVLLRKDGTTDAITADKIVEFDTTVTSEGGMTVSGTKSRITVPKAGKYAIFGAVAGSNTTPSVGDGWRLDLYRDGAVYGNAYIYPINTVGATNGEEYNLQTSLIVPADANDYFEFKIASIGAARASIRYGYFCVYYLG